MKKLERNYLQIIHGGTSDIAGNIAAIEQMVNSSDWSDPSEAVEASLQISLLSMAAEGGKAGYQQTNQAGSVR